MQYELFVSIGAIFVLLIFSAFFSGSETALTAASRARLYRLEKEGDRRAMSVNRMRDEKERLIGAILLGNNLVNILASALATRVFIMLLGDAGVIYATLAMTALVLIFAEVLPKTYAISNPDKAALAVSLPIGFLVRLLGPIVMAIEVVVRGTLKLFGVRIEAGADVLSAYEELRGAIDLHAKERGVKRERYMLGGILDLEEVTVGEIMIHRRNMVMLNADEPPAKLIDAVMESPFTRIPIWRNDPDNIVGILHSKDILRALKTHRGDWAALDVVGLAVEPWFVPETTSLKEQLDAFRARHAHFALVVDEYGALMGLVTLEDILEEIVGEISDEFDITRRGIRPQKDGSVVVDGTVTVRDLNREMDWNLPDDRASTIAGLVINEARTIPEVGQRFHFFGYRFNVVQRRRNQITLLEIRKTRRKKNA